MPDNIPIVDFAQASKLPEIVGKDLLQACADWGRVERGLRRLCSMRADSGTGYIRVFLHQEPSYPAGRCRGDL